MSSDVSNSIIISNLYKTFSSAAEELEIISNLNLTIEPGKKVVISGESGCGKSTLLHMISGFESVSSGSILIDGEEITTKSERELAAFRKNKIGFIFQFHYLLNDFSALENIALPAIMSGTKKAKALEKAKELLSSVGLQERATHFPTQLSGGERQRVAVARALINDPTYILADEPTGNLDQKNSDSVVELLFSLVEKYNKTLILVTHDLNLAKAADHFYLLESGSLVDKGEGR